MTLPTSEQPGQPPGTNPEKACPICGKPAVKAFRPFCSARCSDVDLNRWLGGVYAIPAAEHEERDDSDGD